MPDNPDSIAAGRRTAPRRLVLVRHGQSEGNVADAAARKAGEGRLALDYRDADTPLSELGHEQARALGWHLAGLADEQRPEVVLCSPYERARGTALAALREAGLDDTLVLDERLRERDLGIFDGLTGDGIRADHPEEAERRTKVGKFYYRPPGGESWCDVALRVRSVLADIRQEYADEHVWVFSHQAVIMSFRLVLEGLDEKGIITIDNETPLPNCSMTSYDRAEDGSLELDTYAETAPLDEEGTQTTREEPAATGADR
ncbi:histidine phosphatase family protein [Arsenicicoccus sp. oral taxon 190]|uniref:histidine phosphatase family protein n=1 Tax=Arsenicicoccus sp. oral taxon 190 TaxID=1658671 RepID=UPI00067A1178|nr:histidine phosphatase family protein [Arsenicicoccus sp. oral taxon 190]AKT50736.1 phosphoglycerate mutase [Arsenicicoccus sp. oral taxon 190]